MDKLEKELTGLQNVELDIDKENANTNYRPKNKKERAIRRQIYDRYYQLKDEPKRLEAELDWEMADKEFTPEEVVRDIDDWKADLHLPDAWAAIQTQAMETIERRARPRLIATESSDEPTEEFSNAILTYNMNNTGFDYQYYLAKLSASIRGTAFLMDYWRIEKRVVKEPSSVDEEGNIKYVDKEIIDFEDDYTEWVPNEYIYVDEKAKHIDEAVDMFKREIINIDEFHRKYDNKPGFKNATLVVSGGDTGNRSYFKMPKDIEDEDVEVLHYYNRSVDSYWVAANNVVIHDGPLETKHKELPLAVQYQYKVPGQFWGIGIPKVVHYLSEERRSIRNLNMDRQKLQINKMFLHNSSFDLDDEDLITRPHGVISIDTNGLPLNQAIQPIEYGDVPTSYFKTEEILLEDIRRAHGIDDRMQGVNMGGTATEAAILKESAIKRINLISTISEMDTVIRVGRLKWSNIQFFYPIPRMQKIVEKDGTQKQEKVYKKITVEGRKFNIFEKDGKKVLDMEDIKGSSAFELTKSMSRYMEGSYDLTVSSDIHQPMSKAIHQSQVTQTFSLLMSNPATMATLDPMKASTRALKAIDENPDMWLREVKDENQMRELADNENIVMMAGQPLDPTPDATTEHTLVHINFGRSAQFQALSPNLQHIITAHILGEHEANPNTGSAAQAVGGAGMPPGGGSVSPGTGQPGPQLAPNTSQPQAQVADLQGANFAQPE